jgi:hypothetical protein
MFQLLILPVFMMNSIYGTVPDIHLFVCSQIGGLLLTAGPYEPPVASLRLGHSQAEKKDFTNICSL